MAKLKIIIITGLSGSGKSYAIKSLEDMGFFCVDNLPSALVPKFVELCSQSDKGVTRIALGIDVREKDFFGGFGKLIDELQDGNDLEVLFFEASDEVLARRFSEIEKAPSGSEGQTPAGGHTPGAADDGRGAEESGPHHRHLLADYPSAPGRTLQELQGQRLSRS